MHRSTPPPGAPPGGSRISSPDTRRRARASGPRACPRRTRERSRPWSMPASGRAFSARRAPLPRSRWPSCPPNGRFGPSCSRRPLGPRALARLAPAVERPGIHLGVWREQGELVVWGTTRAIPSFCFVLEVLGAGLMVVKHRTREDSTKFQNVAVFEGEQVKGLSPQALDVSEHPPVLRSLIAPEPPGSPDDPVDVLLRLAVSMRAHKRGGTLLVVPTQTETWRESIVRPIEYAVEPAFTELADLVREAAGGHPSP